MKQKKTQTLPASTMKKTGITYLSHKKAGITELS
jgi:hypothetical protein